MEDLKPSSREEAVLAKIAGIEDPMVDAFEPSSREEWFMNQIAERMGEGGGGSGGGVFVVDCTMDEDQNIIAGKTAGEIFDSYENGNVIFKLTVGTLSTFMNCVYATNNYKSGVPYAFSVVIPTDGGNKMVNLTAETPFWNPVSEDNPK